MKFLYTLLVLVMTSNVYAEQSSAETTIQVPAAGILSAVHWIKPKTGPYYEVSGNFRCVVVVNEFPPYGGNESCSVEVDGEASVVANPELLISELQKVQPMTGPYYRVEGTFKATSISSEVPPYVVTESAELTF